MRKIYLIISIIILDIYLYNLLIYNRNYIEYPIRKIINNYTIGIEGISIIVMGLILSIIPIVLMIVPNSKEEETSKIRKNLGNKKIMVIMIILLILIGGQDLIIYYITYEIIIIPIYYLITREGSHYKRYMNRGEAGIRIMMYTIIGGIMILGGIIIGINKYGTTDNEIMNYLIKREGEEGIRRILNIIYMISFFIKIPIFPFHIWLPIAHSEAPTYGSVILASIILKIASYGIIRYNLPIMNETLYQEDKIFLILILISIVLGGIIPIRGIIDLKKILAYSSIVHMGVSTIGLIIKEGISIEGGIIIMITHGWISGGMFILIGNIYTRYKTRINIYYQGLIQVIPIWSILIIIYMLGNIGIPISYGFIGEIKVLSGIRKENIGITIIMIIGIVITNMMIIYKISKILYGSPSKLIKEEGYKEINKKEIIILLPLIVYLYGIMIYPEILISIINWATMLLIK